MSLINLNDVKYRQTNRRRADGRLNSENLAPHLKMKDYLPPAVKRQSTCEIEVDAWASDIKNKEDIEQRLDVNPGLAAIWAEEKARRILAGFEGEDSQLGPPSSPPRSNLQPTDNDLLQMQRFQRKLIFVSQSEESSVSMNSNSSSYPVELDDEFNLLDASHLERHIGPRNENRKHHDNREETEPDSDLVTLLGENLLLHHENERSDNVNEEKSLMSEFKTLKSSGEEVSSQNQNRILNQSTFEEEDIPLVDILEKLAEGHKTNELVEEDSILGSHCSAVVEYKSDEEDEDGITDLNLTTFEIDLLTLNSELTICSGRPGSAASVHEKGGTSFAIKSLSIENSDDQNTTRSQRSSQNSSKIPQFDGADDLPRKRSSSVERSASMKRRKVMNKKDVLEKVVGDLNKVKGREKIHKSQSKGSNNSSQLDNAEKEEFRISDASTFGSFEPHLDRTLVSEEKELAAFECKSTISENSESADDLLEYAGPDHTVVVVEKLICDYKSSKGVARSAIKEMIVNYRDCGTERRSIFLKDEERKLRSSSSILESPKRTLRSSNCDLMSPIHTSKSACCSTDSPNKALRSPSRALKSPSYALRSPSRALRSPRKSLSSPRQYYASLNITVTPSKKRKELSKKFDIISEDDESSEDAPSKEMPVFTQKRTYEDQVCNTESNRKLHLSNKATLVKSSEGVCEDVSPNRKLVFSQKSKAEEICKDAEAKKKHLLSSNSQSRKHSEDIFWENITLDRKCILSQKSRSKKISDDEEIHVNELLSQKSQFRKSPEDYFSANASTNRKLVFSQTSRNAKSSEDDEIQEKLFFSQISQVRKCPENELSKDAQTNEILLLSDNSTGENSLEGDESNKETFYEIPLTNKSAPEKNSQDKLYFLSDEKSFEANSCESNLLKGIYNISPQLENKKMYDEETDSSDFEGNFEVLLKNLNSDSKSSKVLPEASKLIKEIIQEETHLAREEPPESDKMKFADLDLTQEINNEVYNTEDLLTLTFSEYTHIQLNSSHKFTTKSISSFKSNLLVAITTIFCAPTRQHILESMHLYGIPACRHQEYFYSDCNDIRAQKDTAHQIINKKKVSDFPQFKSEIGGVVGIKLWRRMKVNEFHSSGAKLTSVDVKRGLAERRLITITPLYFPSSRNKVVKWLKARKRLRRKEKEKVQERKECEEKSKNGRENKGESSNSEDASKINPFGSNSLLEVSVHSGGKSRDSLSEDSSLCKTLRPSELLISEKKKKKLGGLSFGQADFSMNETKTQYDVANQNLQNAKTLTTVSLIFVYLF